MIFSSIIFLFLFLPLVLTIHFSIRSIILRNFLLVISSLIFYFWGEKFFIIIIFLSIFLNYYLGIWIEKLQMKPLSKIILVCAIVVNLFILFFFKYASFLIDNLNSFFNLIHLQPITQLKVHLPAGISFLTFHVISYIIDIYRKTCKAQKDPVKLLLYFTFFPQILAGPIIRYHDIEEQLSQRSITTEDIAIGIQRFIIGLGKKVLIANTLADPTNKIFEIPSNQLTPTLAWLGIIFYTLQIYFDFSGYSDMAIGLARVFGFHFPENFNYPYISRSIREFWRRWHISLSAWLRDYLYIPLGGNRCSPLKTYLNLLIVFFLCGLWHGASWNFIVWGLFHGFFLILERWSLMRWLETMWLPLRHAYTLIIVLIGWVFFRSSTLDYALNFIQAMLGFSTGTGIEYHAFLYLNSEVILTAFIGIFAAIPVIPYLLKFYKKIITNDSIFFNALSIYLFSTFNLVSLGIIFLTSSMKLASNTYNPFIYFRF
jgi:alginate O-acetyltransferase complex protein AlgI